jgi:hypothetical protein
VTDDGLNGTLTQSFDDSLEETGCIDDQNGSDRLEGNDDVCIQRKEEFPFPQNAM